MRPPELAHRRGGARPVQVVVGVVPALLCGVGRANSRVAGLPSVLAPCEAAVVPPVNRRTATRVRDGRVQKKNNWAPSPGDYRTLPLAEISLERRKPAEGHRRVPQLRAFLGLLPAWEETAVGVRAIVLGSDMDCYGWYQAGTVAICNRVGERRPRAHRRRPRLPFERNASSAGALLCECQPLNCPRSTPTPSNGARVCASARFRLGLGHQSELFILRAVLA
jgi:hypothetical protein